MAGGDDSSDGSEAGGEEEEEEIDDRGMTEEELRLRLRVSDIR